MAGAVLRATRSIGQLNVSGRDEVFLAVPIIESVLGELGFLLVYELSREMMLQWWSNRILYNCTVVVVVRLLRENPSTATIYERDMPIYTLRNAVGVRLGGQSLICVPYSSHQRMLLCTRE